MLAEPVIRALRAHVSLIEQYEADLEREHARLWEPRRARMHELYHFVFGHGFPYPDPLSALRAAREARGGIRGHAPSALHGHVPRVHDAHVRGIVADVYIDPPDVERGRREIIEISNAIKDALARFAAANKPEVTPYDTPSKLAEWIDDRLHSMDRRRRALENTATGRSVIASDPGRFPRRHSPDLPVYPEAESRDTYREARRRALAFAALTSAVLDRLPVRSDPIFGLQDIQAWFAAVDRQLGCDGSASDGHALDAAKAIGQDDPRLPHSLDSKAVGIAHEMLDRDNFINVAEVARRLGEDRTKLYRRCPAFRAMVAKDRESREAAKGGRPRGSKDRRHGTVEAWRDDE